MYEILGISLTSFNEINHETSNLDDEKEFEDEQIQEIEPDDDSEDEDENKKHNSSYLKEYNNELVNSSLEGDKNEDMIQEIASGDDQQQQQQNVVKKPFLKRGVGLTSRFRIPPDKFNLTKLPRYKYQDRLQKTLNKQKGRTVSEHVKSEMTKKTTFLKPSAPKITNPTAEKVTSELKIPKNIKLKVPTEIKTSMPPPQPALNLEKLLQKTPPQDIQETPKQSKRLPKGTSWAQVLSSNNINDCSINMDQLLNLDEMTENELDGTNLFQLLEERIKNLESSPVSILNLLASLHNKQSDPNDPIIENAEEACLHLNPRPDQLTDKIVIDDSEVSFEESEDENDTQGSDHRVRFAENVQIHQDNQEETRDETANSSILSTDHEAIELTQTSTPNERQKFEDFKVKFLGRQMQQDDLKEKVDLLKLKLEDIEREKAKIIQMRSNLELERLQFENERDDLIGQMRDERMKMEMEMHDERVKVDQQKQKYDKLMRDGKNQASKKEREEIAKLKESIDELKEEMKNKEARHASTSARYRTQIKQLEKDNQTFKLELEVATKDNKRMEVENARLKRDTSNKMLQEINKNIAKLVNPDPVKVLEEKKKVVALPMSKKNGPTANRKSIQKISKLKEISSSSDESEEEIVQSNTRSTKSQSDTFSEMKREIVNSNGSKDIWYPNGNLKKISSDGMLIRMLYYNKDIKETNVNEGTVKYYYADNNTWHTTYIDGLEILEYPK